MGGTAHIPALRSLSDDFEITALSTSRRESADAANKPFGVPAALDNVNRKWTPDRITVVLCDEALGF